MKIPTPRLLDEFIQSVAPMGVPLLGEWMTERMCILLAGETGAGKSFFCYSLTLALAAGKPAFGWRVPEPIEVGYFDGENPASVLKDRMVGLISGTSGLQGAAGLPIKVLTREDFAAQGEQFLDLSQAAARQALLQAFQGAKVLFLDNVNCLFPMREENSTREWESVQALFFEARARGMTVVLVHHTSKSNRKSPAGSSRNTRVADLVLVLSKAGSGGEGAYFELECQKDRYHPKDLQRFTAKLVEVEGGGLAWDLAIPTGGSGADDRIAEIQKLKSQGLSVRAIESQLSISKSTVQRLLKST